MNLGLHFNKDCSIIKMNICIIVHINGHNLQRNVQKCRERSKYGRKRCGLL